MKLSGTVALCLVLASCAVPAAPGTRYVGADAGYVVVALGTEVPAKYNGFFLNFRPKSPVAAQRDSSRDSWFDYQFVNRSGWGEAETDFKSHDEQGVVIVASLAPGDYEIFASGAYLWGVGPYSSRLDSVIPFSVSPGKTVYLGRYQAHWVKGHNLLGMPINGGAEYSIRDEMTSDMEIARKKGNALPLAVVNATPRVSEIRLPPS